MVKDGHDVAIYGLGAMLPEAQRLAAMLENEGFSAAVINPRFAKPIDRACVAEYARSCGLLVTLEDHVLAGGFGSAVLETLNTMELPAPVVRVGWPDEFIEHGKVESLRAKYGLTAEAALEKGAALSGGNGEQADGAAVTPGEAFQRSDGCCWRADAVWYTFDTATINFIDAAIGLKINFQEPLKCIVRRLQHP